MNLMNAKVRRLVKIQPYRQRAYVYRGASCEEFAITT